MALLDEVRAVCGRLAPHGWADLLAAQELTAEQRRVTQEAGTERPFTGEYNDHKEPGIYVDIVSGEPLFASSDKFARCLALYPSFIAGSRYLSAMVPASRAAPSAS